MSSVVKENIKALRRKRDHLKRTAKQLNVNQVSLIIRLKLLSSWCDSLELLKAYSGVGEDPNSMVCHCREFIESEKALLQQLDDSDGPSCAHWDAASELLQTGVDSISPAGDPMAYFKQVITQGDPPAAASCTPFDIAQRLRSAVLHSSLHLNLKHIQPNLQSQVPLQQLWDRYLKHHLSVVFVGRDDVSEMVACYNLEKLAAAPEYGAAAQQRTALLPPLLHLTEQQKDLISAGLEICQGLLEHVLREWQELVPQMAAAAGANTAGPAADAGAAAGTGAAAGAAAESAAAVGDVPRPAASSGRSGRCRRGDSSSSAALGASAGSPAVTGSRPDLRMSPSVADCAAAARASNNSGGGADHDTPMCQPAHADGASGQQEDSFEAMADRWQQLELQHQQVARLRQLMAKEYLLVTVFLGFFVGVLSYEQLAQLHVVTWPYGARLFCLAEGIKELRLQELQQQRLQPWHHALEQPAWQQLQNQNQEDSSGLQATDDAPDSEGRDVRQQQGEAHQQEASPGP